MHLWLIKSYGNLHVTYPVQYLDHSKSNCYLLMIAVGLLFCQLVVMLIPCTFVLAETDGHSSSNTTHNSAVVINLWFCWCTGFNQHYSGGSTARTGRHSELQVRAFICQLKIKQANIVTRTYSFCTLQHVQVSQMFVLFVCIVLGNMNFLQQPISFCVQFLRWFLSF